MKRLEKGYQSTTSADEALAPLYKTNFKFSVSMALLYNVTIWLAGGASFAILHNLPVVYYVLVPLTFLFGARQQRAIENMIHDASHLGWSRGQREHRLADLFCNLFCGWPTGVSIEAYRGSHKKHHAYFGSDKDPCRARVPMLRGVCTLSGMLKALPRYTIYYYCEIGSSPRGLAVSALWHATSVALLAVFLGIPAAFELWLLAWALPGVLFLPAIRMLAEGAEHDYERGAQPTAPTDGEVAVGAGGESDRPINGEPTEFSTTFDCVHWLHRYLLRPWNDYVHLGHHMYPRLPQSNLGKAHRILLRTDPTYASRTQQRTGLFN